MKLLVPLLVISMINRYLNVCACNKCKADLEAYDEHKLSNSFNNTIPDNYFTMAWELKPGIKFNNVTNYKGRKNGIN